LPKIWYFSTCLAKFWFLTSAEAYADSVVHPYTGPTSPDYAKNAAEENGKLKESRIEVLEVRHPTSCEALGTLLPELSDSKKILSRGKAS